MKRLGVSGLGICETRWTGVGEFVTEEGNTVIYSGGAEHKYGVAMILDCRLSKSLLGYNTISDRIMTVRIAANPYNLTIVQVYAPTAAATDSEKEAFYEKLQQVCEHIPRQDIVIQSGDWNAKLGKGSPIGKFAMGTMNDNGERLCNYSLANSFMAANCLADRHPRHSYTWESFDGVYRNQIDYFLVQRRWRSAVRSCRAYQGPDCDSDHSLVRLTFKLRLRKHQQRSATAQYEFANAEQFALELRNRFAALAIPEAEDPGNSVETPNTGNRSCAQPCRERARHTPTDNKTPTECCGEGNRIWKSLRDTILDTAKETLTTKRRQYSSWISGETLAAIEAKRKCRRRGDEYRALRRTVRRMIKADKRAYFESICEELAQAERTGRSDLAYKCVERLTKKICPTTRLIRSETGAMLTDDVSILDRWKNYCEDLYSTPTSERATGDGRTPDTSEGAAEGLRWDRKEPVPSVEEIEKALKSMKPGKAVGPDKIPAEMLRIGGETVARELHRIIECVWESGQWPEDWTRSTFIPLYKKGDPTQCSNYRTISMISHASKVLLKVIQDRIRVKVEFELDETQAGFRAGRGTRDHLCNLRSLTERARAHKRPLYLCFVDFEKAFDTVNHTKLWKTLEEMGFAKHLVTLIRSLYENQRSNVRLGSSRSEWFAILKGLRQGCNLSPYLFNILAEALMRLVLEDFDGGFRIGGSLVTNLKYADDNVLATSSQEELQELTERLHRRASEFGMRINVRKTKVMKVSDDPTPMAISIDGKLLEQVDTFKYLGAIFNENALCDQEIAERLRQGRERMGTLKRLWRSRVLNNSLKAKLVQTLVWPIVTYGCESWTLKKHIAGEIQAFEMWCYRRVLRIPYVHHVTNDDVLEQMSQKRLLLGKVQSQKLKYFGHIARHPSLENDIALGYMPGRRRQGGQRRQWIDDITDWAGKSLPEVVTLARDRRQYRQLVHKVVEAPHGV